MNRRHIQSQFAGDISKHVSTLHTDTGPVYKVEIIHSRVTMSGNVQLKNMLSFWFGMMFPFWT